MNLSSFILLNEKQKWHTVLHQGVLLAKRDAQPCKVFLFGLDNYYVETWCNLHSKSIEEYRMFNYSQLPQHYLQSIALDDLWP